MMINLGIFNVVFNSVFLTTAITKGSAGYAALHALLLGLCIYSLKRDIENESRIQ